MKVCNKCGHHKPVELFKKNIKCSDGRTGTCKVCVNEHLKAKRASGAYKANREKANIANSKYRSSNKEYIKKSQAEYQRSNRAKYNAYEANRRARLLLASVDWSCQEAIKMIYEQARLSGMEVDHIIPLQGAEVCGLHWEGNLQLLTPTENRSKGNRI